MMVSSIWAAAFTFVAVQTTTGVQPLIAFLSANPESLKHLIANGVAGTIFLYLLFYIVKHQGPVMLSVIQSLQKIVSVILSSVLYGHPMSALAQFCAFGAILGALCITFLSMKRRRREATLKRTGHLRNMFRATARMRGFSRNNSNNSCTLQQEAEKTEQYGSADEKAIGKAA